MSSSAQRKRRRPGDPPASRTGSKTGRAANANRAATVNRTANPVDATTPTETINVMDSVEEVVDLTCEGSEPLTVVDLTHSDSVLLVDEGPQNRTAAQSYIVSSDEDEDTPPFLSAALMSSLRDNSRARCTSGTISCPICMDSYSEIVDSGRLVVSTKCGHVFCSQCLRDALSRSHTCPTCRKKLTPRQYHPLYV